MSDLQEMTKINFDEESKSQDLRERSKYYDSKLKRFTKRILLCFGLLLILVGIIYWYEHKISGLRNDFENRFESQKRNRDGQIDEIRNDFEDRIGQVYVNLYKSSRRGCFDSERFFANALPVFVLHRS